MHNAELMNMLHRLANTSENEQPVDQGQGMSFAEINDSDTVNEIPRKPRCSISKPASSVDGSDGRMLKFSQPSDVFLRV